MVPGVRCIEGVCPNPTWRGTRRAAVSCCNTETRPSPDGSDWPHTDTKTLLVFFFILQKKYPLINFSVFQFNRVVFEIVIFCHPRSNL